MVVPIVLSLDADITASILRMRAQGKGVLLVLVDRSTFGAPEEPDRALLRELEREGVMLVILRKGEHIGEALESVGR